MFKQDPESVLQRVSMSVQTDNKVTETKSLPLLSFLVEYFIALILCKVLTKLRDGTGVEYLSLLLQSIQSRENELVEVAWMRWCCGSRRGGGCRLGAWWGGGGSWWQCGQNWSLLIYSRAPEFFGVGGDSTLGTPLFVYTPPKSKAGEGPYILFPHVASHLLFFPQLYIFSFL